MRRIEETTSDPKRDMFRVGFRLLAQFHSRSEWEAKDWNLDVSDDAPIKATLNPYDGFCVWAYPDIEQSAERVYKKLREEIEALKLRVLQRVVLRVRAPTYCADCNKGITRHAAQTRDGKWHHLGCITQADSPHYRAEDDRVLGAPWKCWCGYNNPPHTKQCKSCYSLPKLRCDKCGSEGVKRQSGDECYCGGIYK